MKELNSKRLSSNAQSKSHTASRSLRSDQALTDRLTTNRGKSTGQARRTVTSSKAFPALPDNYIELRASFRNNHLHQAAAEEINPRIPSTRSRANSNTTPDLRNHSDLAAVIVALFVVEWTGSRLGPFNIDSALVSKSTVVERAAGDKVLALAAGLSERDPLAAAATRRDPVEGTHSLI